MARDVLDLWREALQTWERQTNEALTTLSADEGVSQTMNRSLAFMTRLQAGQGELVERVLVRANLPSRADFRALGDRLDGIEAQLGELRALLQAAVGASGGDTGPSPAPKPARTRKLPQTPAP